MRPSRIPLSILLLSLTCGPQSISAEESWPYNLPPDARYFPEDEPLVQRQLDITSLLANNTPVSVRKMSSDPGEMFFLEYYEFDGTARAFDVETASNSWSYLSNARLNFDAAMLLHSNDSSNDLVSRLLSPRSLWRRSFQCPSGTEDCADIGRPNSCCPNGSTCNIVKDTGLGDVGCCENGSSCDGDVAGCPSGYSTCTDAQGGGCCIPGYACQGDGCVKVSTKTVTPTSTSKSTSTSTSTPPPPTSSTKTAKTTSAAPSCTDGFHSCPASLGGGCCPTDRVCASSALCKPSTTTTAPASTTILPAPPVKGTSDSAPTTTAPTIPGPCPSNFYACSAYYPGAGCCQIGRDCSSTSCPARQTASELVTDGVTVLIIPTGTASITQGACANGWQTCAQSIGGGCCPDGYGCGTAICSLTATATGTAKGAAKTVAKENTGASRGSTWSCWVIGIWILGLRLLF